MLIDRRLPHSLGRVQLECSIACAKDTTSMHCCLLKIRQILVGYSSLLCSGYIFKNLQSMQEKINIISKLSRNYCAYRDNLLKY